MKFRKITLFLLILSMVFMVTACSDNKEPNNTESIPETETETEEKIVIIDAMDVLAKAWDEYSVAERFDVMGGHFNNADIGLPAEYDLLQTEDLIEMYCVPEEYLVRIDDAATMTDFYNVGRFTVGAYHISDEIPEVEPDTELDTDTETETETESGEDIASMSKEEVMKNLAVALKTQMINNTWHGETPEKVLILEIDKEYIIALWGRDSLVIQFKQKLETVYEDLVEIMIYENFPENF